MSEELNRISLTIPQGLLDQLDEVLEKEEYSSHPEAFRDALRDFLADYQWKKNLKGKQRGTIVTVYDHEVRGLNDELLEVQHEDRDIITSVQHLHISHKGYMETIK